MNDTARLLDGARHAAVAAGDAILRIAGAGAPERRAKDDRSPLTAADLAADAIVLDALRALDPSAAVLSEETPCDVATLPSRFWVVDPLDGTREFLAGNGEYTVNVALVEDGRPVLGVVHAPARGVTYAAVRGRGALRYDRRGAEPIRTRADGPLTVVASRSHREPELALFLAALCTHDVVEVGSSLKLCLVADGTAQLYPRLGRTCWWDTAAAHAVVDAAGGFVATLDGKPLRYAGATPFNAPFVCTSLPHAAWLPAARALARARA